MADNKFTAMMLREEAEQELLAEAWGPEHRIAAADWRAAADHMEACEAALRASTELLRSVECHIPGYWQPKYNNQIDANKAVLRKAGVTMTTTCELCGEPSSELVGCSRCGKLVCPKCLAAIPDDEDEGEDICEEIFW